MHTAALRHTHRYGRDSLPGERDQSGSSEKSTALNWVCSNWDVSRQLLLHGTTKRFFSGMETPTKHASRKKAVPRDTWKRGFTKPKSADNLNRQPQTLRAEAFQLFWAFYEEAGWLRRRRYLFKNTGSRLEELLGAFQRTLPKPGIPNTPAGCTRQIFDRCVLNSGFQRLASAGTSTLSAVASGSALPV